MCEFFSSILTKQGELIYNFNVDHHDQLVEMFDLRDDQISRLRQNFVRLEFKPDPIKDLSLKDSWKLTLDEREAPDWFDKDEAKKKCWNVVKNIVINDDSKPKLFDGIYILTGEAEIDAVHNRTLIKIMNGSSQIGKMLDSSRVDVMRDSSQVGMMVDSSHVRTMVDSSQVGMMLDSSRVGTMHDSSQVGTMDNSSHVDTMFDSSQVGTMVDSSQVGTMYNSSHVRTMYNSSQSVYDRRG